MPKKKKQYIKKEKVEVKKVEEKETLFQQPITIKKSKDVPQLVRGMKDILDADHRYFDFNCCGDCLKVLPHHRQRFFVL